MSNVASYTSDDDDAKDVVSNLDNNKHAERKGVTTSLTRNTNKPKQDIWL